MRVASHQPAFLPWAGYWHKVMSVDTFVLQAGVQWAKDGYLNRIRHQGAWLTLPVDASDTSAINEVTIGHDARRIEKTWKAVAQVSGPYKKRLEPVLERLRNVKPGDSLMHLNVALLRCIAREMSFNYRFVLNHYAGSGSTKTDRLDSRLRVAAPHMTSFYMGAGTASYFDPERFARVDCFVQDPYRFAASSSILQLIAKEPDPADWIMSQGVWRKIER
ncbi:MAG: WbqC family protein [Aquamicrobium sp.]|uniref:WbqC family protein n=1 Tax=Aquamicrobium sp. TaxID=1872579 RepID=UPI00349EB8FA|nr:WbqC family protein [Aquamicrobium sp.]